MIILSQYALLGTHPTKIQQPNDPTRTKKIELKKKRRKVVNTCIPTRQFHIQLEKKEKEGRMLKYFQDENDVMFFMKLRGRK